MKATIILDPNYTNNKFWIVKFIKFTSELGLKESKELLDKAPVNNYKISYDVVNEMGGLMKYFKGTCVLDNGNIKLIYNRNRDLNLVKLGITTNTEKIVDVLTSTYDSDILLKKLIENVDSDTLRKIITELDVQENEEL